MRIWHSDVAMGLPPNKTIFDIFKHTWGRYFLSEPSSLYCDYKLTSKDLGSEAFLTAQKKNICKDREYLIEGSNHGTLL